MPETPQPERFRILVVEDDPYIGRLILSNLEKANLQCRLSPDGIAGLTDFREFNPHLVLTDIMMPGMDGRSLCATLREISMVPILLMTAADTSEAELAAFKAGADDYVPKPFDPKLLVLRITAHLRRVYRYDAQVYQGSNGAAAEQAAAPAGQSAGTMTCQTCGFTAISTDFRQETQRGERILMCPQCREREHFTVN